eukprot:211569_1
MLTSGISMLSDPMSIDWDASKRCMSGLKVPMRHGQPTAQRIPLPAKRRIIGPSATLEPLVPTDDSDQLVSLDDLGSQFAFLSEDPLKSPKENNDSANMFEVPKITTNHTQPAVVKQQLKSKPSKQPQSLRYLQSDMGLQLKSEIMSQSSSQPKPATANTTVKVTASGKGKAKKKTPGLRRMRSAPSRPPAKRRTSGSRASNSAPAKRQCGAKRRNSKKEKEFPEMSGMKTPTMPNGVQPEVDPTLLRKFIQQAQSMEGLTRSESDPATTSAATYASVNGDASPNSQYNMINSLVPAVQLRIRCLKKQVLADKPKLCRAVGMLAQSHEDASKVPQFLMSVLQTYEKLCDLVRQESMLLSEQAKRDFAVYQMSNHLSSFKAQQLATQYNTAYTQCMEAWQACKKLQQKVCVLELALSDKSDENFRLLTRLKRTPQSDDQPKSEQASSSDSVAKPEFCDATKMEDIISTVPILNGSLSPQAPSECVVDPGPPLARLEFEVARLINAFEDLRPMRFRMAEDTESRKFLTQLAQVVQQMCGVCAKCTQRLPKLEGKDKPRLSETIEEVVGVRRWPNSQYLVRVRQSTVCAEPVLQRWVDPVRLKDLPHLVEKFHASEAALFRASARAKVKVYN